MAIAVFRAHSIHEVLHVLDQVAVALEGPSGEEMSPGVSGHVPPLGLGLTSLTARCADWH